MRQAGTWDSDRFAIVLASGQMSPPATKYKETIRDLKITMCTYPWSKLWMARYKKTKNTTAIAEEPGANQGTAHTPCTQHHQEGGQTTQRTPPA